MNAFIIRKAKKEDVEAIVRLQRKLAVYHRKLDKYYAVNQGLSKEFEKFLRSLLNKRNTKVLVVESRGGIVGYSIATIEKVKPYYTPKKNGLLSDMFLQERFREKGIGKQLFKEQLAWFKKRGIKHIELTVDARNKKAEAFWRKFEFKDFAKRLRLDLTQ